MKNENIKFSLSNLYGQFDRDKNKSNTICNKASTLILPINNHKIYKNVIRARQLQWNRLLRL